MYSIYDKVAYKTTDYKTKLTTINKKMKISKSGIYSLVYIVSELTTRLHWLQLIKNIKISKSSIYCVVYNILLASWLQDYTDYK